MQLNYTSRRISDEIEGKLMRYYAREPHNATIQQYYKATCAVVRDIMSELWLENHDLVNSHKEKEVYYLSMEFLPGASLRNNLCNLHLDEVVTRALANFGKNIEDLFEIDPDAGLGNGGLGRLASCYLDAIASNGMGGHGMSICYEFGIFKQAIENGHQVEKVDDWQNLGDSWLLEKEYETEEIHLGGSLEEYWEDGKLKVDHKNYHTVLAIPNDFYITGYDSKVVNTLRLYRATSPIAIDMDLFSQGKYLEATEQKHMAEIISKILYPEDAHDEGKILRLTQQYFFTSAGMQAIVKRHIRKFKTLRSFPDKVAIHINDTHPAMAIPELMRIFIDEHRCTWEEAWDIVNRSVSYTNHTVMPEALEKWPENLLRDLQPRIHSIIAEINRRMILELTIKYPYEEELRNRMAIIIGGEIKMANLCVASSHSVNGVSELHSEIIRKDIFSDFYRDNPEKFTNVTNGIAYRRWLCQANPKLSGLIEELIGPEFKKDAIHLEKLLKYKDDKNVLSQLEQIKRENKGRLAEHIAKTNGIIIDPDSIFDVQVKRFHEYKRQLLNLFHIIYLYDRIKAEPNFDIVPRTFIFAGKAAAGYHIAKKVISLACHLGNVINKDPDVRGRIKVVFLENYSVSLSEIIMPAADLSEQISLAGKEASGTGNMKLMINGALTIGTYDGANIEINTQVGDKNMFLFGMREDEVERLVKAKTYSPYDHMLNDKNIYRVITQLSHEIDGECFNDLANMITNGTTGSADQYFVLADFESYRQAQKRVQETWQTKELWNQMSLVNIAKSGVFSADRSVNEYAERIWGIKPIHGK
ncbi:MAG: glycogen/starch/alpha-glucan phosphorylase [Proteocatella sp.]